MNYPVNFARLFIEDMGSQESLGRTEPLFVQIQFAAISSFELEPFNCYVYL